MTRRTPRPALLYAAAVLYGIGPAIAEEVAGATGRTVRVPDCVARVFPAAITQPIEP